MPIEIREIVIRAEVQDTESRNGNTSQPQSPARSTEFDKEILIQECADQVLRILDEKKER